MQSKGKNQNSDISKIITLQPLNLCQDIQKQQSTTQPKKKNASSMMQNLFHTISQYQNNLSQFQCFIQASVNKNAAVREKCSETLSGSMGQLKTKFVQFANEWKIQLPQICKQFIQIVRKICQLYQQEINKLTQMNAKWQFSYHQLLKAKSSTDLNTPVSYEKIKTQPTKQLKNIKQQNYLQKSINQFQPPQPAPQKIATNQNHKQVVRISDEILKIKQSQFSLMRQQITQLFQQQSQLYEAYLLKQKQTQSKNKSTELLAKNIDQIKQFRLQTSNDQNILRRADFNIQNFNGKQKGTSSYKSSQFNSRKNSIGLKQHFWSSLQNNIAEKQPKMNKTTQGKQNNISSKQRLSYNSKQSKQFRKQQQKGRLSQTSACGSKLHELKRNLYKNKVLF